MTAVLVLVPVQPGHTTSDERNVAQAIDATWNNGKVVALCHPAEKYTYPIWTFTRQQNPPYLIVSSTTSIWNWMDVYESFTSYSLCVYEDDKGEAGRCMIRETLWSTADVVILTHDRLRADFTKASQPGIHGSALIKTAKQWMKDGGKRIACMQSVDTCAENAQVYQKVFQSFPGDYIRIPREWLSRETIETFAYTHTKEEFCTWVERLVQERELLGRVLDDAQESYSAMVELEKTRKGCVSSTLLERIYYLFERRSKRTRMTLAASTEEEEEVPPPLPDPILAEPVVPAVVEAEPIAVPAPPTPPVEQPAPPLIKKKKVVTFANESPRAAPPRSSLFTSTPPSFRDFLNQQGLGSSSTNQPMQVGSTKDDWYVILAIGPKASPLEIKQAYNYRANLKHHPDKNNGVTSPLFYKIQEAFRVLKDPISRDVYDRFVYPHLV